MKTLNILIGVSGSGKSTFTKENIHENDVYINADSIRNELLESRKDHSNENLVWQKVNKDFQDALRTRKDIWFDNTNRSRKRRHNLYVDAKNKGYKVISHFFVLPMNILVKQDDNRNEEGYVGYEIIKKQFVSIEPPIVGIDTDEINCILSKDTFKCDNPIEWMVNFISRNEQDIKEYNELINKKADSDFHNETFFEHVNSCIENSSDKEQKTLALFHDLGKILTFEHINGKDHYYGHEVLSSYLYFAFCLYNEVPISNDMIKMIRWHMMPFNSKESLPKKLKNREQINETLEKKIFAFNRIDVENSNIGA